MPNLLTCTVMITLVVTIWIDEKGDGDPETLGNCYNIPESLLEQQQVLTKDKEINISNAVSSSQFNLNTAQV